MQRTEVPRVSRGGVEMQQTVDEVQARFPDLQALRAPGWDSRVAGIWVETWGESAWKHLEDCPYNPLAPKVSLVAHVNQVVRGARALATLGRQILDTPINDDVLLAAAFLHDVSKLVEYEPDADGRVRKSELGRRYQHGFYGAYLAQRAGMPAAVVQIILNHTGASREIPDTPEALCIYYADLCAADLARLAAGAPLLAAAQK